MTTTTTELLEDEIMTLLNPDDGEIFGGWSPKPPQSPKLVTPTGSRIVGSLTNVLAETLKSCHEVNWNTTDDVLVNGKFVYVDDHWAYWQIDDGEWKPAPEFRVVTEAETTAETTAA